MYAAADQVRIEGITEEQAELLYARTVRFVTHFVQHGRLLDVGCGSGWLPYFFARRGFEAFGIDLKQTCFEVRPQPNLSLSPGDATTLPFPDGQFDVVIANTALEHMTEPEVVLRQMARVLKPGGLLFVTGPNLVAVGPSVKACLKVWSRRPLSRIFFRCPDMPRFPFGTTLPEIVGIFGLNLLRIARKMCSRQARFEFRAPDVRPPFYADNDAVYLCNPIDVCRFLRAQGFQILRDVDLGRGRWTTLVAGGTWVAARKRAGT